MRPDLKRILAELRRRKVLGVAAAYAVVAWGVLQVSGTVLQMAGAPLWVARVVLLVVAAGFPVALVLAWFFDLSAAGLVRTEPLDPTSTPAPRESAMQPGTGAPSLVRTRCASAATVRSVKIAPIGSSTPSALWMLCTRRAARIE